MSAEGRRFKSFGAPLALMTIAGCTSDQAAIYGKLMLGLMVVFLIGIPIVFYRAWRRRARH